MGYNKEEVREALSIDDVYVILNSLGAEPEMFHDEYIVSKTICHGGDSRKLYYYDNNKLFQCYTHCGSFDIFQLIMNLHSIDLDSAIDYVVSFFNLGWKLDSDELPDNTLDWEVINRYKKIAGIKIENEKKIFPAIDRSVIEHYPQPRIKDWEEEGISQEMINAYDIRYDPVSQSILIPHTDVNNRLIGIRKRVLLPQELEYGKYRPASLYNHEKQKYVMYNHGLGFNLYGLYMAKQNIANYNKVIVVEGEKSVLKIGEYLGLQNQIGVAVCGSNLTQYQLQLLLDCGATEVIIAFDADYEKFNDEKCQEVAKKLQKMYNKYSGFVQMSFMWDKSGDILHHKMSPTDAGKENFLKLFRERVSL